MEKNNIGPKGNLRHYRKKDLLGTVNERMPQISIFKKHKK